MKITANEEYGLRVILAIARISRSKSQALNLEHSQNLVGLSEIAEAEGISTDYSASIISKLREAKLVESVRGKHGGYKLTKNPSDISLYDVLHGLGEESFTDNFCGSHTGVMNLCNHSSNCAIRPVWATVNTVVNQIFKSMTLEQLMNNESQILEQCQRNFGLEQLV